MTEERKPLAVVVVATGRNPRQCQDWQSALAYVGELSQDDDPIQVSMFTIYWGDE